MKKKFYSLLTLILLTCLLLLIFIYSKDVMDSIIFSISIWKENLLPSLFPFFLMSELLLNYGFVDLLSFFFGGIINKVFGLPKEASFVLIASLFSGFPSGAKCTKDLLDRNIINEDEANHLITFTHFSNPMFLISTVGIMLLNNKAIGVLIMICHIITGLLVGLIFKKKNKAILRKDNTRNKNKEYRVESFSTVLKQAIINSFLVLVNMLGIIMFFLMITTLVNRVFPLKGILKCILSGILEMTQGVKFITSENVTLKLKASLIGLFVSFSGISVHFQVKSIIDGTAIKYKYFLIARIIHALLCFSLIYSIFDFFI